MKIIQANNNEVVATNSTYVSYEKKAYGKQLYNDIKNNLKVGYNQILRARFFGESPKGSDLENILFYNIGSGCFSSLIQNGVIFEEMPQADYNNYKVEPICVYEYSIVNNTFNPFSNKNEIATCSNFGDILNMSVKDCWLEIKKSGWYPKSTKIQAKEIYLDITISKPANKITIDKIKHMLDGIVSSLHKYSGNNSIVIANKLGAKSSSLLIDRSILFDREFVSIKTNGGLKWNPADDRKTLKGCRIQIGDKTEIKVLV